ncbi:hypothetical protein MTR67_052654 [Solanum verrucosum]|uniref:RCD1 WWE domain-containing protein n=1 Tax=Solanum verrucosum TaxID=315347 RepID=A0AAF1A3P5_SOLVR|nr:hypothetical protein MTR67_052654 [Solanum verrucosum]
MRWMCVLISAFVSGKAMIEVEMEAGFKLIVDFYRMFGIDLDTGNELPISWIDVDGNFFIPKIFIEDSEKIHEIEKGKRKKVRRENVHLSREEGKKGK